MAINENPLHISPKWVNKNSSMSFAHTFYGTENQFPDDRTVAPKSGATRRQNWFHSINMKITFNPRQKLQSLHTRIFFYFISAIAILNFPFEKYIFK